jgi:hypothetical protein
MSKRNLAQLYWKLRPFYRVVPTGDGALRLRWAPMGIDGGRLINFDEFKLVVQSHERSKMQGSGPGLDSAAR